MFIAVYCIQFAFGQLIRIIGGEPVKEWIIGIKPVLSKICETMLLFIIFCAISQSFYSGLDAKYWDIISISVVILLLHIITLVVVWILSALRASRSDPESDESDGAMRSAWERCCDCKDEWMRFNIYDRIAILFCSSQKTCAFGIPIVISLYEGNPNLGIYLVPLLIFKPIQLIIDSLLVQPLSNKVAQHEKEKKKKAECMEHPEMLPLLTGHSSREPNQSLRVQL